MNINNNIKYRCNPLIKSVKRVLVNGFTYGLFLSAGLCTVIKSNAQVPTSWSNTQSYKSGSLVLNHHGNTFIAQQNVSSGIPLSNTTYWASLEGAAPTSVPGGAPFTPPCASNVPVSPPQDKSVGFGNQQEGKSNPFFKYLILNAIHAGSSVDIDDLKITNLDNGRAEWTNNFNDPNGSYHLQNNSQNFELLTEFDFMDGNESWYHDSSLTRVLNNKLRLQTIGFRRNWPAGGGQASEGYNSESAMVYSTLPKNFKIEFKATKLQYNGHFSIILQNSFTRDRPDGTVIWNAQAYKQETPRVLTDGSWENQGEKTIQISGENNYRIEKLDHEISFHLNGQLFSKFVLNDSNITGSSVEIASNIGSESKVYLGDTEVVVGSSTQDTSLSHACCGGEDLHKEEQDRAGPRPGNPGGSGYVDYKLEWEKATVRLASLEEEIRKEEEKLARQDIKITTLGEEIANRMAEISKTEEDLAKCEVMGAKLLAELSSKEKVLGALDNNIVQLVAKRQNLENEILQCNQELAELSGEYTKLEEEYAPLAAKLAVPHIKGWHYEAEQGWLYVEIGSYPYVFSERLDAWMYYKQGSHTPWEYFNYNTQSWVAWR